MSIVVYDIGSAFHDKHGRDDLEMTIEKFPSNNAENSIKTIPEAADIINESFFLAGFVGSEVGSVVSVGAQ